MTATALMDLASRKLQQAKTRSESALLQWQNAIHTVDTLSQQLPLGTGVAVPSTQEVASATEQLKDSDYFLALSIKEQAQAKEKEVFGTTIRLLEQHLAQQDSVLKKLQQDMHDTFKDHEKALKGIEHIKTEQSYSIIGAGLFGVGIGIASLIISFPLGSIAQSIKNTVVLFILGIIILLLLLTTLFGWLIVPIIQIIRHRNDGKKALERHASEEKRLFMKRDERVKNIENTVKETEVRRKSIQDALRTLRQRAGT
jgi:hypothetical protein